MRTLRRWQEALRRETFGDDHVSVNVEIWSGREEVLRASACLSSEGQGRGLSPENEDRAGERTGPIHEVRRGHASHDFAGECAWECVGRARSRSAGVTVAEVFLDHRTTSASQSLSRWRTPAGHLLALCHWRACRLQALRDPRSILVGEW